MESIGLLTETKVKAGAERCDALLASIEKLQSKILPSPATKAVMCAISTGLFELKSRLARSKDINDDLRYLSDTEVELKVHKDTQYLPFFYYLLGLVGPSDVSSIPPELAAPLRRQIKGLFGDAVETIITSSPNLNYTIREISADLRQLLQELGADLPVDFPEKIFVISIPAVEYDHALLHCILAHEMGHPLFKTTSILQAALEKVTIDQSLLQGLIKSKTGRMGKTNERQITLEEILLRTKIVESVNETIPSWVEEICADLFGLLLFGPAYLASFIYFSSSFLLLDGAAQSHPPSRLRLLYVFTLFDRIYRAAAFSTKTKTFLDGWRTIANQEIVLDEIVFRLALKSMKQPEFMDFLIAQVCNSLPQIQHYTQDRYSDDITNLAPFANAVIPPIEWPAENGGFERAEAVAVLNVGWECFLEGLEQFRKCLRLEDSSDFQVSQRFNALLMKSLELIEIRKTWEQTSATVGGAHLRTGQ